MTNFERIHNMSIDELASFLNNECVDDTMWSSYFQSEYCDKCKCIKGELNGRQVEFAYCEVNDGECSMLDNANIDYINIVKIWLESDTVK